MKRTITAHLHSLNKIKTMTYDVENQAIYMDRPVLPTWMLSVHLISQDMHKDKYNHFRQWYMLLW